MAPSVRHVTSDRLQVREGGGGIALFGLPFFAAGIFLGLTALGLVPMSNAHEMPAWGWPALVLMAVAFTGVGGTLVFGRSWTTIDIAQRTVLKQWGLLLPLRERSFRLDDYSGVTLSFVRGDSDSADRFPVGLSARSGADLPLCSFTEYAESRTCAVAIARHARLDVEDATTDHPIRLAPDQADQPFHLAAWTKRVSGSSAERPHNARSEVGHDAGGVRIVIPKPRRHALVFALGLIPLAVPLIFAPPLAVFFRSTHTPDPVAWTFLGFLILFFGILPATSALNAYVRSRRGGTIVFVSPQGIRIQDRGAWRTTTVASLEAADIVDVDYSTRESAAASARQAAEQRVVESKRLGSAEIGPRTQWALTALARLLPSRGLTVKTRHGLTSFGEGLDDEEVRYLYSVVLHALRES
jgi:hypothetical protein